MTSPSERRTQNELDTNSDLAQRERIRYEWMLSRIQGFKSLVLAIIVAMMGYVATTIDSAGSFLPLVLLCVSAFVLLISVILAGLDAGGAVFYNEKSQDGVSKQCRWVMYMAILLAAFLVIAAKVCMAIERIQPRAPLESPNQTVQGTGFGRSDSIRLMRFEPLTQMRQGG